MHFENAYSLFGVFIKRLEGIKNILEWSGILGHNYLNCVEIV